MRILILGGDGYLGWPQAMHFAARGHQVMILDNLERRLWDDRVGVGSVQPIAPLHERLAVFPGSIFSDNASVLDWQGLELAFKSFNPDAVVHFAEQRAAPYSMIDRLHAVHTQTTNVIGTLNILYAIKEWSPDAHLVKLGSMGVYGQPNITIREGWLDVHEDGRSDRLPFPMRPGSWYHASKVHDSHNIEFACRTWGLRATDLHQGVVYGIATDETEIDHRLWTRYDYDEIYGTALNRFCVQAAVGHPITVYGEGGQTRGWIDIRDTVRCIDLAAINPPEAGEYRVMNQITESFSVLELAQRVSAIAAGMGYSASIKCIPNPRVEREQHFYRVEHTALPSLGLEPHSMSDETIRLLISRAVKFRDRIDPDVIAPTVNWRETANRRI